MIKASAPGSVMLLGEHAVLFGHRSLVLAVDKRIYVTITERNDEVITLSSSLATCSGSVSNLPNHDKLSFVCQAISNAAPKSGFDLTIKSEFSHTIGLASSAAVTVATVAALNEFNGAKFDKGVILEQAVSIIRQVQGRGSGSDAAACVFGGAVAYCAKTIAAQAAPFSAAFSLYYLGYKTPTPEVLSIVERYQKQAPELYSNIYESMGNLVEAGLSACENDDAALLATIMRMYQGNMHALGVVDSDTHKLLARLYDDPNCLAAKISGSGLGDCIIALGENLADIPFEKIAVTMTKLGVSVAKS